MLTVIWIFIVLCVARNTEGDGTVALPECTKGENDSGMEWRTEKQMVTITLNASNVSTELNCFNYFFIKVICTFHSWQNNLPLKFLLL